MFDSLGKMHYLAVDFIKNFQPRGDDDFIGELVAFSAVLQPVRNITDRLNYYYTPIMIGVGALIVTAKQHVGQPIQCWVPPQFTTSMEEYIETYCWVQNTYWLPMHSNIPDDHQSREGMCVHW